MFTCYHTHWGLIKDDVGTLDIEWENNSDNASGNAAWSIDIFTYGFSVKTRAYMYYRGTSDEKEGVNIHIV